MLAKRSWRNLIVMTIALGILLSIPMTMSTGANRALAAGSFVSITPESSIKTTNAYWPNPLHIRVGDTVIWTNKDSTPHTVTSGSNAQPDGSFDSSPDFNPLMAPGKTFSHTFEQPGRFPYYCGLHPNMVGTIIVQDNANETITISVATGNSFYEAGNLIEITGKVIGSNETINQPIMIQVIDPEDNTDWVDQVQAEADGSFSYSFRSSILMNTDGIYTMIASYKNASGKATFQFAASDKEPEEMAFTVKGRDKFYHIQYWITGGRVVDMVPSVETSSFTVIISSISYGELTIKLPRELIDSRSGADEDFVVFLDEMQSDTVVEINPTNTSRTLTITLPAGTETIEIVGTWDMSPPIPNQWETAYAVGRFLNSEPSKPDQIFKFQYRVMSGTVDSFDIQQERNDVFFFHTIIANVSSTGNGVLEIKYPRNFPYTNSILYPNTTGIEEFVFLVEDEDGSIEDSRTVTDCFFVFSIPFTDSIEINMVTGSILIKSPYHGDDISQSCVSETTVENVPLKQDGTVRPMIQVKAGVLAEDVLCPEGLERIMSPIGKPHCASESMIKFLNRVWHD